MFAVVEIGGRQYKVSPKETIEVEKLEKKDGETVTFHRVLLIAEDNGSTTTIGKPYVEGATVEAKIIEQFKGEKIRVFKFIAKKRHKKTQGHRQNYTRIEITGIKA